MEYSIIYNEKRENDMNYKTSILIDERLAQTNCICQEHENDNEIAFCKSLHDLNDKWRN